MTTKQFTVGEKVKLVTLRKSSKEWEVNWILQEPTKPDIGDIFTVTDSNKSRIRLAGLVFSHPASKFTKGEDDI